MQDKLAEIEPIMGQTVRNTKCCKGCTRHNNKLHVYDWLSDFEAFRDLSKMVEVQFKNTRKDYFINSNGVNIEIGDLVAVESTVGHDIGKVTLIGKLVELQMKKNNYRLSPNNPLKRIYRVARPVDIEKYEAAKAREQDTMIRSREIAENLGLNMKIGDVEFQGDGNKAIFYYIADERVDFRQLIKILASEFKVKIEMKQIGARQEAGLIGGIGPCGRELCCSNWISNFVSVSTASARCQDIAINPQKLAGQCGKLKCCMNYEVDMYVEAQKGFPSREVVLETKDDKYTYFKSDILAGTITYSSNKKGDSDFVTITKARALEVINMNKNGKKPFMLNVETGDSEEVGNKYKKDILEGESISRFDNVENKSNKKRQSQRQRRNRNNFRSKNRKQRNRGSSSETKG